MPKKSLVVRMGVFLSSFFIALGAGISAVADDFTVYSIYSPVDLGNPGEQQQKDYYVNMGTAHGLNKGAIVMVYRKAPSYDVANQKLYKDVTFPFAKLRIIHTEESASIGRLEVLAPSEKVPALSPRAVIVGDIVRLSSN